MSVGALNETLMELEVVVRQYSETLITQLALRDELEYEKELKNSFISLLLQVSVVSCAGLWLFYESLPYCTDEFVSIDMKAIDGVYSTAYEAFRRSEHVM